MIYEITSLVEVWDDAGNPIADLSFRVYYTYRDLHMTEDKFAKLISGNKLARVRREVAETIGGPGYSSIRVTTSIELSCDQHETTIKAAADAALEECYAFNDDAIMTAFDGLKKHRQALKLE